MRLGYVLKCFPRLSETFILNELLGLERLGAEVTVLSRYRPSEEVPHAALGSLEAKVHYLEPLLQERFWEPFEIHRRLVRRFGPSHDEALRAALSYRSRQELRYWLLAAAVAEKAVHQDIDCLHGHFATGSASVARYASRITGVPYSSTAHAKDIYSDAVDRKRLRDLLVDASFVVTVSDANVEYLNSIAPEANVVRVYNGLDLEQFSALPEPPSPDPPLLLSVARLVEKKGIADLLSAVAALRNSGRELRCRLVGSGPLEEPLRAQAQDLGLDGAVEFIGSASQEEVLDVHLPAASAYVLPCVVAADGDRDGLPTTLLEAMARGVPVVSTRLPGVPEAVPHGEAGLLADEGDVAGLTRAIASTLEDREATTRRVGSARRHIESLFDSRKNTRQLFGLFEQAANLRGLRTGTGL